MNDADANADSPMKEQSGSPLFSPEDEELLAVTEMEEIPSGYHRLFQNFSQLKELFTLDDWIDILTRSRGSYEDKLRGRRK